MDGQDGVVGVLANGADQEDLEGWEVCVESLAMSCEALDTIHEEI